MKTTTFVSFSCSNDLSMTANVKCTVEQRLLRNTSCLSASSD